MKQKGKKTEFNDLLFPIIIIIMVIPFITRLIIYSSGLSGYSWYSNNDILTDFSTYYKSYLFIIISIVCAIISFIYGCLYKNDRKALKPFILLGIYIVMVLLSTAFSVDRELSVNGGISHFESVFVLIGYVVLLFYTYRIHKSEQDYRIILWVIIASSVLFTIIGVMQMFGKDIIAIGFIQKLIIPRQYWKEYLGKIVFNLTSNAVSLTLFNSNFASVYLAMLIPFLISIVIPVDNLGTTANITSPISRNTKRIIVLLTVLLTILLFKTYSRAGLVAMLSTVGIMLLFYYKHWKKYWKTLCGIVLLAIITFVGIDALNEFRYVEKIIGTFNSFTTMANQNPLEKIITEKEHILIRYQGEEIKLSYSIKDDTLPYLEFWNKEGEILSQYYDPEKEILDVMPFESIHFFVEEGEGLQSLLLYCVIDGITWRFVRDDMEGYLYLNDFGKTDQLGEIDRTGFHNTEHIGSGRGYIWSRSIPLLKETILLGKGPDTFPIVFPQSDYVGKANNAKTPYTLIAKPHNMYLMTGIHTGILSLLAVLAFYLIYLFQSIKVYRGCSFHSFMEKVGLGCLMGTISYMISGFFNDSSLQTTPFFIILLGLGMDINHKLKEYKKT